MPRRYKRTRKKKKKSLAKQVRSNKYQIARIKQDIETKYIYGSEDMEISPADFNTNKVYFNTDIYRDEDDTAVQDGRDKRIGDKIRNKVLFIRGYFDNKNEPVIAEDTLVRVIIGKWIDNTGATFGAGNVLVDSSSINSLYNIENNGTQNYKILFDHTFAMDHVNYQLIPFKARFMLKDQTLYEGQTTEQTITNVRRNVYFIMARCECSELADSPHFKFTYKFSYTDS